MGVEIGLYIEAQEGTTWHDWSQLARRAETLGFDSLVCSVHIRPLLASGKWTLDLWPVMTALALWTKRIRFGPMVLPITFYNPIQIARISASLDQLSGGRFRLRLGAGRDAGEHEAFGIPYPEHDQRISMLGEALEIIRLLWSGNQVSFTGQWYHLEEAQIQPVPQHPWVGTGGNSESSLRVAASGADEWCTAGASEEQLRQLTDQLNTLAHQMGRNPRTIDHSLMNGVLVGRNMAELKRHAKRLSRLMPDVANRGAEEILDRAANEWRWWVGTPKQVVTQVQNVLRAQVNQIFFQIYDYTDLQLARLLAQTVIPGIR